MIPRIRTVKPQLFTHEGLFEAELKSKLPLRLAFIGLFTCCDCEGRFQWTIRRLKVAILPYDAVNMSSILETLCEAGFIQQYESEGVLYGCIPSWHQHQRINHREAQSLCPAPEQSSCFTDKNTLENKEIAYFSEPCFTEDELCSGTPGHARGEGKGMEGNGREEEGKGRSVVPARPWCTQTSAVHQIFEHWKQVMVHPSAVLDPKRRSLIGHALKLGYSSEQLCQAINGCSLTPHNQGDNDRGTRYDGLHIILRDAEQIDRFMHNAKNPPRTVTVADRLSQNNAQILQGWADRKRFEFKEAEDAVYEV